MGLDERPDDQLTGLGLGHRVDEEAWKHSHNYIHHTYTNVVGMDRDLGYEIMRIDPEQEWHPIYLLLPLYNLLLMALFEWGVALHDLDFTAVRSGEKSLLELAKGFRGILGKARRQIVKDYVLWPALSGPSFLTTLTANFTANVIRNIWAYAIIFCGHFPDQTYTFSREQYETESEAGKYVRQLLGAANIDGSPLFHVISGNLGYQVEHHLYSDMPSTRYGEIAPRVREICQRYELPYNTGPLHKQLAMMQRTILRLAFPGGKPVPSRVPTVGPRSAPRASATSPSWRPPPSASVRLGSTYCAPSYEYTVDTVCEV